MITQSLDRTFRGEISQSQEISLRTAHQQLFQSQLVRKHSKVVGKHIESTIAKEQKENKYHSILKQIRSLPTVPYDCLQIPTSTWIYSLVSEYNLSKQLRLGEGKTRDQIVTLLHTHILERKSVERKKMYKFSYDMKSAFLLDYGNITSLLWGKYTESFNEIRTTENTL
jgi:hypothetical protein